MVSVGVLTTAVLAAAGAGAAGAVVHAASPSGLSDSDCATVNSVEFKGNDNGYYGKTALNASKAIGVAARDVEDKSLKDAMTTLAKIWGVVGRQRSVIAAAKRTAKFGDSYGRALTVFTTARLGCAGLGTTATTEPEDEDQ